MHVKPVVAAVGTINVALFVPLGVHDPLQVTAVGVAPVGTAVNKYVPPFRVAEQVCVLPFTPLHEAPGGLLVKDAVLVAPETTLSVTVDGVGGVIVHPVGSGDTPLLHGSIPCRFTVTVGEPVVVVNVQLPEPGALGWLRSAVITTVV